MQRAGDKGRGARGFDNQATRPHNNAHTTHHTHLARCQCGLGVGVSTQWGTLDLQLKHSIKGQAEAAT